jgi:hypothetical protein
MEIPAVPFGAKNEDPSWIDVGMPFGEFLGHVGGSTRTG